MPPTQRESPRNRWCVTFNNPPTSFVDAFASGGLDRLVLPHFKHFMGQLEESESGTPHLQLSLWTIKKVRFTGIKRICNAIGMLGCHIEPMRGTWKQSTTYCSKDDPTYRAGPWSIGRAVAVGKAALMERLVSAVHNGDSIDELLMEVPGLAAHRKAFDWLTERSMKRAGNQWRDMDVQVFMGEPGTDKTRLAVSEAGGYDNVYILTKLNRGMTWWDGYDGELTVIIDDFDSEWTIPYRALLRILDGHPTRLPVKGGFRYALFTRVVITTNVPISVWYPKQRDLSALERRISSTRRFPEPAASGTENGFTHTTCENVGSGSRTGGNTIPQSDRRQNFLTPAPLTRADAFIDLTCDEQLSTSDSFIVHDTSSSTGTARWFAGESETVTETLSDSENAPKATDPEHIVVNTRRELFTVIADSDSGDDEGPMQLQRSSVRTNCPVELSGGAPQQQEEM